MNADPLIAAADLKQSAAELLELVKDQEQNITTLQLKALIHILNETKGYVEGIKQVLLLGLR